MTWLLSLYPEKRINYYHLLIKPWLILNLNLIIFTVLLLVTWKRAIGIQHGNPANVTPWFHPHVMKNSFFSFTWFFTWPYCYYFICDQDAWFCLPQTNILYTFRTICLDFSEHGKSNSKNHYGLKFQLKHQLQNEATFDYSGTPPRRITDSLFIWIIRALLPKVGIL